jgi:hypothetical protein
MNWNSADGRPRRRAPANASAEELSTAVAVLRPISATTARLPSVQLLSAMMLSRDGDSGPRASERAIAPHTKEPRTSDTG